MSKSRIFVLILVLIGVLGVVGVVSAQLGVHPLARVFEFALNNRQLASSDGFTLTAEDPSGDADDNSGSSNDTKTEEEKTLTDSTNQINTKTETERTRITSSNTTTVRSRDLIVLLNGKQVFKQSLREAAAGTIPKIPASILEKVSGDYDVVAQIMLESNRDPVFKYSVRDTAGHSFALAEFDLAAYGLDRDKLNALTVLKNEEVIKEVERIVEKQSSETERTTELEREATRKLAEEALKQERSLQEASGVRDPIILPKQVSEKTRERIETVQQTQRLLAEKLACTTAKDCRVKCAENPDECKASVRERVVEATQDKERAVELFARRDVVAAALDSDGDKITDFDEINIYKTDPDQADSDNDGIDDGKELLAGTHPTKSEATPRTLQNPRKVAPKSPEQFDLKRIAVAVDEMGQEDKLTIEGRGPANSFVTLYIFSTPVVVTVETDEQGNFVYELDSGLEDGEHQVFLAMTDDGGDIVASTPAIPFVKQARAVTVGEFIPDIAAATSSSRPSFFSGPYAVIGLGILVALLIFCLVTLGVLSRRHDLNTAAGENVE